jgi:hypothetical protein
MHGNEQCFEEARGSAGCFVLTVGSMLNFNLLNVNNPAELSSQMDLEHEEGSIDISMAGSPSVSFQDAVSGTQPKKLQRVGSKTERRRHFESSVSFESNLNQTAISNASSTINENDAVGVPTKKEEATINTKLAMRELSMMFSSPAFGVDERRENDRSIDRSFGIVGDGLMLDNSICINGKSEIQAPTSSCKRVNDRTIQGITTFEEFDVPSPQERPRTQQGLGFQIYEDHNEEELNQGNSSLKAKSSPKSCSDVESNREDATQYVTLDTAGIPEAVALVGGKISIHKQQLPEEIDEDDTATLSLFNDILQNDDAGRSEKPLAESLEPFIVGHDEEYYQNVRLVYLLPGIV